jgi:hypothetical protein
MLLVSRLQLYGAGADPVSMIVFFGIVIVIVLATYYGLRFLFKVNRYIDMKLKQEQEQRQEPTEPKK